MQSRKWFFNGTLFLKNVTRFWPIWAIYTAIWVLILPVPLFIAHMDVLRYGDSDSLLWHIQNMLNGTSNYGLVLAVLFSLLCAVAVFSYLNTPRAAGLMHTLPIRREGLFLTNWLSGYSFLLIPHLVVAVVSGLVQTAAGVLDLPSLLLWVLIQSGTCFFFYSFAVFCAMFTGHVLAMPAFFFILNFLAVSLDTLIGFLMPIFTFGYVTSSVSNLTVWLTPSVKLAQELHFRTVMENGVEVTLFTGFQFVLIYAVVGLLLSVAALFLYRIRHVEAAGDVITFSWAKPIFKYGFALCAALCGGLLLYSLFAPLFSKPLLPLMVFTVLSGIVGFFVAEMLLQKSFKVFAKGWLSCLILSVALVLGLFALSLDFLGLSRWVPQVDQVTSVSLSGHSLPPYDQANWGNSVTDPEAIAQLITLHQAIVDNRDLYQQVPSKDTTWAFFFFHYTLADGSDERRQFSVPLLPEDPVTSRIWLETINHPAYLMSSYFPYQEYNPQVVSGSLTTYDKQDNAVEVILTATQAEAVAAAVQEDVLAGRLGIHYMDDNDPVRQANCSRTDLELISLFTPPYQEDATSSVTITPQFTATRLMETLTELGILDENHRLLSYTTELFPSAAQAEMPAEKLSEDVHAALPDPTSTVVSLD